MSEEKPGAVHPTTQKMTSLKSKLESIKQEAEAALSSLAEEVEDLSDIEFNLQEISQCSRWGLNELVSIYAWHDGAKWAHDTLKKKASEGPESP